MTRWSSLTVSGVKAAVYGGDPAARESLADACEVVGRDIGGALRQSALVVLKPDAVAGRRLVAAFDLLRASGFIVTEAQPVMLAGRWRELWLYQLSAATLDRLAAMKLLMGAAPSLVLWLRPETPTAVPASVRLALIKGPPDPALQADGSLRRALSAPNGMLSFVHVADEPADVVRELGILYDEHGRRHAYARLVTGEPAMPRVHFETIAAGVTEHVPVADFDVAAALVRLDEACRGSRLDAASEMLARARTNGNLDFRALLRELRDLPIECEVWDLLTVATSLIRYDRPNAGKRVETPALAEWAHGRGVASPA